MEVDSYVPMRISRHRSIHGGSSLLARGAMGGTSAETERTEGRPDKRLVAELEVLLLVVVAAIFRR
jgi:hypothetical protein